MVSILYEGGEKISFKEYIPSPNPLKEIDLTPVLPLVNRLQNVIKVLISKDLTIINPLNVLIRNLLGLNFLLNNVTNEEDGFLAALSMPHKDNLTNLKFFERLGERIILDALKLAKIEWRSNIHFIFPRVNKTT